MDTGVEATAGTLFTFGVLVSLALVYFFFATFCILLIKQIILIIIGRIKIIK